MKLLAVVAVLAVSLALQTGLGRIWPDAPRFVDVLMVPVIWYGIAGSQRSGMLVGCAAGLVHDAWFQAGAFGISGFKKTLVGWALGGLGSRFDLNSTPSRFTLGAVASLSDSLLDLGLRRLLDQSSAAPRPLEIVVKALVTGALVVAAFGITRWRDQRRERRSLR
jgi:cell shape-determining protein MreD